MLGIKKLFENSELESELKAKFRKTHLLSELTPS